MASSTIFSNATLLNKTFTMKKVLTIIKTVFLIGLCCFPPTHAAPTCKSPTDADLQQILHDYLKTVTANDRANFIMVTKSSQRADRSKRSLSAILDDPKCPASIDKLPTSGVNPSLRSTCPWIMKPGSSVEYRYPSVLDQAHCICLDCIGHDTDARVGCEEITVKVPVLYRKENICNDGVIAYDAVWEEIAVGCTCTRKTEL